MHTHAAVSVTEQCQLRALANLFSVIRCHSWWAVCEFQEAGTTDAWKRVPLVYSLGQGLEWDEGNIGCADFAINCELIGRLPNSKSVESIMCDLVPVINFGIGWIGHVSIYLTWTVRVLYYVTRVYCILSKSLNKAVHVQSCLPAGFCPHVYSLSPSEHLQHDAIAHAVIPNLWAMALIILYIVVHPPYFFDVQYMLPRTWDHW